MSEPSLVILYLSTSISAKYLATGKDLVHLIQHFLDFRKTASNPVAHCPGFTAAALSMYMILHQESSANALPLGFAWFLPKNYCFDDIVHPTGCTTK